MPLVSAAQSNFASGVWRSVARHLIPEHGCYDLANFLLDEDGSPYRRGGSEYLSTGAFGTSLRMLWDGNLVPGPRTFLANTDDFGVLDGSEGPVNLGLAGLSAPKRAVELAGLLFVGGGTIYGGSRKTAAYSTGTVAVTQGSVTVTGTGTTWTTNIDAGGLFRLSSGRYYVVKSVDSNTQLTLSEVYEGATASGQSYSVSHIVSVSAPYRTSDIYAVAADRLFSVEGDTAFFTDPGKPANFDAVESFHKLPEGSVGLGAAGLGDRLLLFATSGMWQISNLHYDLTDVAGNTQHRVEQVHEDLILWSHEGIATWGGALVAPCADGVWLVDGVSAPRKVSKSIDLLYRSYVAAGYKTGLAAVFRSHYLLPVLDGSNVVQDLLVCRLDRPIGVAGFGTVYPWTRQKDFSGRVTALAVRTGSGSAARNPLLLAASEASSARVLKCNSFFGPDVTQKQEPDGTVHATELVMRDWPTGDGLTKNTVRSARLRYELVDAATDNPTVSAAWTDGAVDLSGTALYDQALWDVGVWADDDAGEFKQLDGQAPEDDGRTPFSWQVGKRVRFLRLRFRTAAPAAKYVIRSVEARIRPTNKR